MRFSQIKKNRHTSSSKYNFSMNKILLDKKHIRWLYRYNSDTCFSYISDNTLPKRIFSYYWDRISIKFDNTRSVFPPWRVRQTHCRSKSPRTSQNTNANNLETSRLVYVLYLFCTFVDKIEKIIYHHIEGGTKDSNPRLKNLQHNLLTAKGVYETSQIRAGVAKKSCKIWYTCYLFHCLWTVYCKTLFIREDVIFA